MGQPFGAVPWALGRPLNYNRAATLHAMPRPTVSLASLEASPDIICVLDADLRILYCNPTWDRFASENDGHTCHAAAVINTPLLERIPDPLARFFRAAFDAVLSSGEPFDFDYECSSALTFRIFRMRILPIRGAGEFMVVHSLRVERPHDRAAVHPDDVRFRAPNGLIVMCCHCRRTRRLSEPAVWDWVPDYVAQPPTPVSTGICSACFAYFYPEIFAKRATANS